MKIYTVHSNPKFAHDPERDPILIREGFAPWAFFLPLPWALAHRLWLVSAGYIIVGLLLAALLEQLGYGGDAVMLAELAMNFLFAAEAHDLQRWTLRRRGWQDAGIVGGDELEEAELRWFAQTTPFANNPWGRRA